MARESRFRVIDGSHGRNPRRSFEQHYRESYPLVYNYVFRQMANREAAEDVVAEAFLRAARFYGRFDASRAKFSTWVISIARNCMSDYYEHEHTSTSLDDVPEGIYAEEAVHDDQLSDSDLVQRLLLVLDEDERLLVTLKYYDGKRNVEIAQELGLNPSTVSTKLARAISHMRAVVPAQ